MPALSAAISSLGAVLTGLLGKPVIYSRAAASAVVTAAVGKTQRETDNGDGFLTIVESRDFLIETANLELAGSAILPQPGDTIIETLGGSQVVFTVAPIAGEPCYRFCDPLRTLVRVHTKETARGS